MALLKLIPANTSLDFMSKRIVFFAFSAALLLASFAMFIAKDLNYGIDFKGGIMIDVRIPGGGDIKTMRGQLSDLGLGEVSLQEFGSPDDILIRIQRQEGDEGAQLRAVNAVKAALGDGVEYRRTEFVGPKVSGELLMNGVYAVVAAMIAILFYIWFRFEWQFGLGAVAALCHDVMTAMGIFVLLGLEFNLTTVAAILTIAGYSINDTVVVFDRVRENLRRYKSMDLAQLLNRSVNETLSRTLMTSVTTLLALLALFFLGGPVIQDFSFAMIWGVLIGTYSSVCLAVPMLMYLKLDRQGGKEQDAPAEGDVAS